MANAKKTLEYLFVSKVRIKSLRYFFFNPDVPIHLRAAVRELNEEINAVRRELTRLEEIKLLKSEKRGNRKYFSLNYNNPFFNEFMSIIHKTFGLGGAIITNAKKMGEIDYAILTSSFTRGIRMGVHDVDLVVIGQIDLGFLSDLVEKTEKKIGREINYTVLKRSEFELRKKRRDSFVMELVLSSKIVLIGREEDLIDV
jgi:DNA-binding transcriptional ArsR family regulator